MEVFVARQPIFTANKKLFGYELLFRLGVENAFPGIDGDRATSSVLTNTFFSFGLSEILRGKPGLINFTKKLILQRTPLLFPKEQLIIEVLENIDPEPEIIKALEEFKGRGYIIALDDFIYEKKFQPMMDLCSIIKFDLMATPLDTIKELVHDLKTRTRINLLAEKVETYQEFEQAKQMGFQLFQGYFFSKPEVLSGKEIPTYQPIKLKLIKETNRTEADLRVIEDLIKKDVSVSFKLLKFLNAAYFKRANAIDTIKDALLVLGLEELKKFINVVVVSDLNKDKPNELIRSSVITARMCELLGTMVRSDFTQDELFTIGLFSSMDAILDMPMAEILNQISLSRKVKTALLGLDPKFNQIHTLVICFQKGEWDHRLYQVLRGKKVLDKLPDFYIDALQMADSFFS